MTSRVQKWGDTLAVRIPKAVAKKAGLREESRVKLSLENGKLVIAPIIKEPPTLEQLLKGVTDDNIHGEWDTGRPVGREAW